LARGFVVGTDERSLVITAAHCLPHMPPDCGVLLAPEDRTYDNILAPLEGEPSLMAECVFFDPIADLAVLAEPDDQELPEACEAYRALVGDAAVLRVAPLPPYKETDGWLLSLDSRWFKCRVESVGRGLWITNAVKPIRGGMSGSPIIGDGGSAIGVLTTSASNSPTEEGREGGPNPELWQQLPGWVWRQIAGEE
jgi:hypothetical protein